MIPINRLPFKFCKNSCRCLPDFLDATVRNERNRVKRDYTSAWIGILEIGLDAIISGGVSSAKSLSFTK